MLITHEVDSKVVDIIYGSKKASKDSCMEEKKSNEVISISSKRDAS